MSAFSKLANQTAWWANTSKLVVISTKRVKADGHLDMTSIDFSF